MIWFFIGFKDFFRDVLHRLFSSKICNRGDTQEGHGSFHAKLAGFIAGAVQGETLLVFATQNSPTHAQAVETQLAAIEPKRDLSLDPVRFASLRLFFLKPCIEVVVVRVVGV